MKNIIDELNNIKDNRRRFYGDLYISSDDFNLSLRLLYITYLKLENDYLVIDYNNRIFTFKVTSSLNVDYVDKTPKDDGKKKKKKRIVRRYNGS